LGVVDFIRDKIMFETYSEKIETSHITRYAIRRLGTQLTFADVLELWQYDADFRYYYSQILAESEFAAFRWETPAVTSATASQPFQFVLLNAPEFCSRKTDADTFRDYYSDEETNSGVVSFTNLGGDATLIVPSPRTTIDIYGHLANFIRNAPKSQVDALWQVVSTAMTNQLSSRPRWLSTAGGGVAWLHVRIDSRPKYYGYAPYQLPPATKTK
jgi:hypothetical protein